MESYAILWIDEQSYFSERWRLLHPDDNKWALLRDWALVGGNTGIKSLVWNSIKHKFDRQKYWCPFEATWFSSKECVDSESRMVVAKQVVIVTGKAPENGESILYSINFSFGTADKTWRWRNYPCKVKDPAYDKEPYGEEACYPKTIRIRDDMTICMLGVGRIFQETENGAEEILVRGYWYQKYLPADNVEVPEGSTLSDTRDDDGRIIADKKPDKPYTHEWQFISESNFNTADRFSHLGVYQTVDSRSQYYKIALHGDSALPDFYNRVPWTDHSSRLWVFTGKPPFVHCPPSLFNNATYLKLAIRDNVGLIAMHWDKRDDELPGFRNVFRTVTLRSLNYVTNVNEPNVRIEATFSKRIKDLTAPIVQVAKVIVDHQSGMVTIYFLTRVPNPSRELPPEPDSQYDNSFSDPDISAWCGSRGVPYPVFENEEGFAPDTSIWKVNIGALDEINVNGVTVFYQGIVSAEFTRKSRYVYCCEFAPRSEHIPMFIKYCGKIGAAKYGTSIWFEDIVGHVNTAERTFFTDTRD